MQQGAELDIELVKQKIKDYRIENYEDMLKSLLGRLSVIVRSANFKQQMERFLPSNVIERTLDEKKFIQYIDNTLMKLFSTVNLNIYNQAAKQEPEFRM